MASLNKCMFIGNLTKDPEMRFMPNGDAVANFSIAVNESYKDKDGNKVDKAEFVNLVAYRKLAEIIGEYIKKGSPMYIEGRLQTRKWQDKEGKDRYTTEIIAEQMQMLGGKPTGESVSQQPKTSKASEQDDFDDDIPF